jgi:hypothetical protein
MARWKAPDYKVVVKFETPREEVNKKFTMALIHILENREREKIRKQLEEENNNDTEE